MLIANNAHAQFSIGAGYINPSFNVSSKSESFSESFRLNGFYAGVSYTLPLLGALKLTPGVYYSNSSYKDVDSWSFISGNTEIQEQYIDIPVMLSFGAKIIPGIKLYAFGGPSLSIGLSSVRKASLSISIPDLPVNVNDSFDNYSDIDGYGRMNLLLGGGAGVELFSHLRIQICYNLGALNRNTSEPDTVLHGNQFSAGAAFVF